jgi:uncharacterized repeat protein (TIGR03803 family)
VFKLTAQGDESVLWNFGKPGDGGSPSVGVIIDASGNLYGTTTQGGVYGALGGPGGTVFKLTAQGNESVLWSFGNGNDGFSPSGGLIMDKSNNFYGETGGGAYFEGTVFSLTANGSESILWNFGNPSDPNDGSGPTGGLIAVPLAA